PRALAAQERSLERWISVPDEVAAAYRQWRPAPLYRAHALERELDTPAEIYFKYEGASPSGSHKLNSALAQAYYAKQEGVRRLVPDTGAGQWGSALAMSGPAARDRLIVVGSEAAYRVASGGSGSKMGGPARPRVAEKPTGRDISSLATERAACATLTAGEYPWDYADATGPGPLARTSTL